MGNRGALLRGDLSALGRRSEAAGHQPGPRIKHESRGPHKGFSFQPSALYQMCVFQQCQGASFHLSPLESWALGHRGTPRWACDTTRQSNRQGAGRGAQKDGAPRATWERITPLSPAPPVSRRRHVSHAAATGAKTSGSKQASKQKKKQSRGRYDGFSGHACRTFAYPSAQANWSPQPPHGYELRSPAPCPKGSGADCSPLRRSPGSRCTLRCCCRTCPCRCKQPACCAPSSTGHQGRVCTL